PVVGRIPLHRWRLRPARRPAGDARSRQAGEGRTTTAHDPHRQGRHRLGQASDRGPRARARRPAGLAPRLMAGRRLVEESTTLVEGPWTHRDISANGIHLHVAELGSGPLVVLLHGFPEFWWAWRHQLVDLADAGWRAVAPDLRGYGASDKPPRGYDAMTLAADVAGLIRALGERDAV